MLDDVLPPAPVARNAANNDVNDVDDIVHTAINTLAENLTDDELCVQLNRIQIALEDGLDEQMLKERVQEVLSVIIKGNEQQALIAGTSAFFIGLAAGVASSSVISQTSLSESYKTLLTGLGAISGGYGRLKLGIEVNKNGGSRLTILYLLTSLFGLTLNTVIAESSKPETINNMGDYRAIGLLVGSIFAGFGIGTFSQVSNVINWHQEAGYPSAILGGIAGLSPGIFGLIRFGFLEILGNERGQTAASGILIGSLITAIGLLKLSKTLSLIDSPCHQLMNHYHLPMNEAIALAKIYGQRFFPSINPHGDWQALGYQLGNAKVVVLIINYISAFGGFLGMTASLNLALASWGYTPKDASLITSLFSLSSSLCRAMIASPINFLEMDALGGGGVNTLGSVLALMGALYIAIPNEIPDSNRLITGLTLMAVGYGISKAATFKSVSSEIQKELLHPVSTPIVSAKANALIACVGTLGSVVYTMGGGQLASQNEENPELGYVQIFYALAGLAFVSGLMVFMMSCLNRDGQLREEVVLELPERPELPEDAQYSVVPKSPHVSRSIFNHSLDDSLNELAPYFPVLG